MDARAGGEQVKKNVLIIAGSPRREGNSDLLCEAFAQGAREANHSVEMVTLRSLHIAPCQACYGCRASQVCVQKDDMETLPVYAQMRGKELYFIATAAASRKAMAQALAAGQNC